MVGRFAYEFFMWEFSNIQSISVRCKPLHFSTSLLPVSCERLQLKSHQKRNTHCGRAIFHISVQLLHNNALLRHAFLRKKNIVVFVFIRLPVRSSSDMSRSNASCKADVFASKILRLSPLLGDHRWNSGFWRFSFHSFSFYQIWWSLRLDIQTSFASPVWTNNLVAVNLWHWWFCEAKEWTGGSERGGIGRGRGD